MKKFILAISLLLLSVVTFEANSSADLSPKAAALNQEIEQLQKSLQDKVEAFNAQVEADAVNHTTSAPVTVAPSETGTVSKAAPSQTVSSTEETDLKKRLEVLELEVAALKKSNNVKPLDGARTPEEAAATKKANETAPLLQVNTPAIAQYNQALSLMENNELEKAVEAFDQILKDYPNDPYAHKSQAHLGAIFKQLGKMDEAEKAYSLALTYNLELPIIIECRLGLAEALISLNKFKPACDQLTIIKKESIDSTQKKRLQEALNKASCQKQ